MSTFSLYDPTAGLFKLILNKSKTFEGRYFVAPSYGRELNTENVEMFLSDPKSGIKDVEQKYPCVVCLPPLSRPSEMNGQNIESTFYTLFFLKLSSRMGKGNIDEDTHISIDHPWLDWETMKVCAYDFFAALKFVLSLEEFPLKYSTSLSDSNIQITPFTNILNDSLNGVSISFSYTTIFDYCEIQDYKSSDLEKLLYFI